MSRRRYLLAQIVNQEQYEENIFNYVYYSLIMSANVKNKGKAKLGKISGNGVIENQWVKNIATVSSNGITLTNNGDGSYSLSGTASADAYFAITDVLKVKNHYLFVSTGFASQVSGVKLYNGYTGGSNVYTTSIINNTADNFLLDIVVSNGTVLSTPIKIIPQLINLTQREGTGNEPTTLTDNRIQKILNGGYTTYSTGSYKASEVSEIEFEPYNLFDDIWQLKIIDPSTGIENPSNRGLSSVNYMPVVGGRTYVFEQGNITGFSYKYIDMYDKNKNFVRSTNTSSSGTMTITLNNDVAFVKIYFLKPSGQEWEIPVNSEVCFHEQGTRTGYSPYIAPTKITLPEPIALDGAINAHNTFEVKATEYEFVRNVWKVDMGSLTWTYDGTLFGSTSLSSLIKAPSTTSDVVNACLSKYPTIAYVNLGSQDKVFYCSTAGNLRVRDTSITDATAFTSAMSGVPLYFELATPQIIKIPKKHLGVVNLGSLEWQYSSSANIFYARDLDDLYNRSNIQLFTSNYYGYSATSASDAYSKGNNTCSFRSENGFNFYLRDDSCNGDIQTLIAKLTGQYLFYNSVVEVADFTNKATFERGGTVTTDSDVLPNLMVKLQK